MEITPEQRKRIEYSEKALLKAAASLRRVLDGNMRLQACADENKISVQTMYRWLENGFENIFGRLDINEQETMKLLFDNTETSAHRIMRYVFGLNDRVMLPEFGLDAFYHKYLPSCLTKNEMTALLLHFGDDRDGTGPMTLREVAEKMGKNGPQSVSQICTNAMRKLRHPWAWEKLFLYDNIKHLEHAKEEADMIRGRIQKMDIEIEKAEEELEYLRHTAETLAPYAGNGYLPSDVIEAVQAAEKKLQELTENLDAKKVMSGIDIEKIGLSVRTANCLQRAGIKTVNDLNKYPDLKTMTKEIRHFGDYCAIDLNSCLEKTVPSAMKPWAASGTEMDPACEDRVSIADAYGIGIICLCMKKLKEFDHDEAAYVLKSELLRKQKK